MNTINKMMFATAVLCGSLLFGSCADDVTMNGVDQSAYNNVGKLEAFLKDGNSGLSENIVELRTQEYATTMYVNLTQAPQTGVDFKVSYDAGFLEQYNAEHGTEYELFPQELVTIDGAAEGSILLESGKKQSAALELVLQPAAENMEDGKTYVLPLKVSTAADGITVTEKGSHCVYLVKNLHTESDCNKGEGATQNFLYFEVNDTNPLNALEFVLENGKLFFDHVVLFAANINWNAETGRVYVYNNPNVQFLLDNNETYLQPLRKRGIKVILGILGNHDDAGVAQLSDMGCKEFARELASLCEAYNLDGVNFDDEYSNYSPDLSNPWFTSPSSVAGARLLYETKKAMPDKLVTVYYLGQLTSYLPDVGDVKPSEFVDIVVADYGGSASPMTGMTLKQCSKMSVELNLGRGTWSATEANARQGIEQGYGYWMWFALDPTKYSRQVQYMQNVARGLYDQELIYPEYYYNKNDATRYPFN